MAGAAARGGGMIDRGGRGGAGPSRGGWPNPGADDPGPGAGDRVGSGQVRIGPGGGGSDPGIGTFSGGQPWRSWQVKRLNCTGVQCRTCPSWALARGNGPRPKPLPLSRAGAEQGNSGGSQVLRS